jgi:hypothetical protein
MELSNTTRMISGVILITVPTIEYGGTFLLGMLKRSEPGYTGNPLRQNLFRAGHAHAGVLVILSLVIQLFVDSLSLPNTISLIARLGAPCAAILMPLGFFLSVTSARAQKPNGLIALVYIGAFALAISTLVLGALLVRSA